MDEKATIIAQLREGSPAERARCLSSLCRDAIDGDTFRLITKIAREETDTALRISAIQALAQFWPDPFVAAAYKTLMGDADYLVADSVITCLAKSGDPGARNAILEGYLKAPHFAYKWMAFQALITYFPSAQVSPTIAGYFLSDTDEVIRAAAVSYLGGVKATSHVSQLMDCLADADSRVRANAVEALAPHIERVGTAPLSRMLADPHHRVRGAAVVTLFRAGSVQVEPTLRDLLHGPAELARATAAYVLRALPRFPGREGYLSALAADPSPVVKRQVGLARHTAAAA